MTEKIYGTTGTKKDGLLSSEQQKALDRRQYLCTKRVQDYWATQNGSGLYPEIAMPTGFGKGRVVHRLLKSSKHDQILTIVGSKNILLDQSQDVLAGLAMDDTGESSFSILPDLSGRTVLATWQGLASFSRKHTKRPGFGLAVIDEAHNTGTRQRIELLKWMKPEHAVGLTATSHRASGEFRAPEDYGFKVVDSMPLPDCIDKRWLSSLAGLSIDTGVMLPAAVRQGVGELNQKKMAQALRRYPELFGNIAKDIADRFLPSGMKTVIVVNRVEQEACVIAKELMDRGYKVGLAVNQKAARELCDRFITLDAIRRYKLPHDHPESIQILISPQVIGEGFDAPATECVIWACPTMSNVRYTQVIGRGSRRCWMKKYCLIVDYVYMIENYGYSLNFAQFFKKEEMQEMEGGFMYVGPKQNGSPIQLPSRFTQGGRIVSVIDLRRINTTPLADDWLSIPTLAAEIERSATWLREQLQEKFPEMGEMRKPRGKVGAISLHYPPEIRPKVRKLAEGASAGNWLTCSHIAQLVEKSNSWVERRLLAFSGDMEMRFGERNVLYPHYPPFVVKKIQKLAEAFEPAADWLTIRQMGSSLDRSDSWVQTKLEGLGLISLAETRIAPGGKAELHLPPLVLSRLKEEDSGTKDAGNWLPVLSIAGKLKVSHFLVTQKLDEHFPNEGEMRVGGNNKQSMHYPPQIVKKLKPLMGKPAGNWVTIAQIAQRMNKSTTWVRSHLKDSKQESRKEERLNITGVASLHYPPSIIKDLERLL